MLTDEATSITKESSSGNGPPQGGPSDVVCYRGITTATLFRHLTFDTSAYLAEREFSETADFEVDVVRVKSLESAILKKFQGGGSRLADDAALSKFLQVNKACGDYDLRVVSSEDEELVGELKNTLYHFFYPRQLNPILLSLDQFLEQGRTGPGASRGANGNDFFTKMFSSPLTTTSEGLYKAYSSYIRRFPSWFAANEIRAYRYGDYDVVTGNRLSFVPKNVDISRCICIEPSLNMFYQLGVKKILEERLHDYFGIDIRKDTAPDGYESFQQSKNRDLAQLASMFDRQWVTIDLSSASDSLSLKMMHAVFPREVLSWLELLRSPNMTLPDGSELALNMVSTMGNGFTFPLQTILFACVVYSAHKVAGFPLERPRGRSLGNFGVYGDDIICRYEVHRHVLRLLELLGFQVNRDKTFVEGPFRESCGGDYFKGHPVRGVYIKTLDSMQDVYVAINTLNRWSCISGIPLERTVRYLRSFVRDLRVPLAETDDAGIKVPRSLVRRFLVDRSVMSVKYRRFTPRQPVLRITDKGIKVPRGAKERLLNRHGLYLAFLCGYVKEMSIGTRHGATTYSLKETVTPYWDYLSWPARIALAEARVQLGIAIERNLG